MIDYFKILIIIYYLYDPVQMEWVYLTRFLNIFFTLIHLYVINYAFAIYVVCVWVSLIMPVYDFNYLDYSRCNKI